MTQTRLWLIPTLLACPRQVRRWGASLVLCLCLMMALTGLSAASAAEPIVVGQTYIGSGPVAGFSTEPIMGINALFARVNRNGGIGGRPLVLRQLDDANSAEKADANVRRLAREGAVAILMPIGTLPSVGAVRAANDLGIPVVGPYTGAQQVYGAGASVFPIRISFAEEAVRIVNHMALIGQTRVAAVRIDNPGAKMPIEAARQALRARNDDLLEEIVLSQDGGDCVAKARQLAALQPQGIILSVSNPVAASFIKAYRTLGTSSQFYGTSFLNGTQLYRDLGAAATGVVIMQVVPSPRLAIPLAAEFRASMEAMRATNLITYASFEGYIAAKTLVEALRKTGSPTPAAVQLQLQAMTGYDIGGVALGFKNRQQGALNHGELSMVGRNGLLIR